MKKVITICLMIITLLIGGMTAEAKTTQKNTKAKTIQTASNINSLLNKYEDAVDILSQFYDEESESLDGWGSEFIKYCNKEETLYQKLKKLEKSMTSEQKSKFKKLAHSLNIR